MSNMVLSEFVMTHTTGTNAFDRLHFADVSVTTESGTLWWKKTHVVRRKIARSYLSNWYFADNGQMCPRDQLEALERSYEAQSALLELNVG